MSPTQIETYSYIDDSFDEFANKFLQQLPETYRSFYEAVENPDSGEELIYTVYHLPPKVGAHLRFLHQAYKNFWEEMDPTFQLNDTTSFSRTIPEIGGVKYFSSNLQARDQEGAQVNIPQIRARAVKKAITEMSSGDVSILFGDAQTRDEVADIIDAYSSKTVLELVEDKYIPPQTGSAALESFISTNADIIALLGFYFAHVSERPTAPAFLDAMQNTISSAHSVTTYYSTTLDEE